MMTKEKMSGNCVEENLLLMSKVGLGKLVLDLRKAKGTIFLLILIMETSPICHTRLCRPPSSTPASLRRFFFFFALCVTSLPHLPHLIRIRVKTFV